MRKYAAEFIGTFAFTLLIEVPIDNQIKVWTASTVPKDWESIRDRWEFFHTARTFISLLSFADFSAGVLWLVKTNK